MDQAAVSSAGRCTGKEKKVWNCIWDTPALSRSAGLWKSSLFSLAVLRKSHRALCKPHNKGSENRRPDLLFWPCCVFTPLSLQHFELYDCFSSKEHWPPLETHPSVGRFIVRHSRNMIHSASIGTMSWPTICTQGSCRDCICLDGAINMTWEIMLKIYYKYTTYFYFY